LGAFKDSLKKFKLKTETRINRVTTSIVVKVSESLVDLSPVGDPSYWQHPAPPGYKPGHFKANWQYGFNHIPTSEIAGVDPDGAQTKAYIKSALPAVMNGTHYLANKVPYALRIEYGWSRQAPQGVVALTLLKLDRIVRQSVAEAQK